MAKEQKNPLNAWNMDGRWLALHSAIMGVEATFIAAGTAMVCHGGEYSSPGIVLALAPAVHMAAFILPGFVISRRNLRKTPANLIL